MPLFPTIFSAILSLSMVSGPANQSPTFIVLLTGEPEASVKVSQHVLVLARLPDVMNSVGQLLPLYPCQLLLLQWRERHVGDGVPRIWGGGLWVNKDGMQKEGKGTPKRENRVQDKRGDGGVKQRVGGGGYGKVKEVDDLSQD